MAAPKPKNVHHKPNLPPKPGLQSPLGQRSAPWPAPWDLRIKPGMVKERTRSLTDKGEGLNRKPPVASKAGIQLSAGTVRDQVQRLDLAPPTGSKQEEEKERRAWMKEQVTNVDHGRSEPDGSEMEDSVGGAKLEEAGSVVPSCPLLEKHCHCICHLHRPGMKLMWVPLQKENHSDDSLKLGDHRVTLLRGQIVKGDTRVSAGVTMKPTTAHSQPPLVAQCINCQSFRKHHGQQSPAESECLYESMDVLLYRTAIASLTGTRHRPQVDQPSAETQHRPQVDQPSAETQHRPQVDQPPAETRHRPQADQPPAETWHTLQPPAKDPSTDEPLYLELQPSDECPVTPPLPPPRPELPLRPHSSLHTNRKERPSTQSVLAYVVSPRGGRLPIRTSSSCKTVSRGKPKLEEKKSDERDSADETEVNLGCRRISSDWASNSDYEPLYQIYQSKVSEAEAHLQVESPQEHRSSLRYAGAQLTNIKLWQDLPIVQQSGILTTLTYTERQRQECMFEVLTSEASYLRSLRVLRDHFFGSRELDETLVIHDRKVLFSNILQVYEVSERFLQDLVDRVDEGVVISDVCDIIHQHAHQDFRVYIDYVRNQIYQEKTYSQLMQCNQAFCMVMRRLEESPLCKRLPFSSFMLLPFQRITRLKILIQSILKRTTEGSTEEDSASRALAVVSEIIREANTQVGQMKQMEDLMHVANILEFDKLKAIPLVSKTRCLEKQGELQELIKGASLFGQRFRFTPVYIFLFNDLIILASRKSLNPERFVVLDHAHRSLAEFKPIEPSGPQLDHVFCLTLLENHQGNTCEHLLKANTESDLHRWMAVFPSVSELQQEKEEKVYEDWDCPQVQCIHQYAAKQADELSLEPCDIINIFRKTNEGWYEGMRLSDRARGWFPRDSVVEVTNEHQRRRNLREQYRINMATRMVNQKEETESNSNF